MGDTFLTNCGIGGSDERIQIVISDGRIAGIGGPGMHAAERTLDLNGATVVAGYIDVHNHGAVGVDVNTATADELLTVGAFLAKNGVTAK